MKTIPGSRRRHHVIRAGIFLIVAALIVGMAGCGPVQYNLTISSTEGGEVTTPGEGMFTYDEGTVVDLVAEADEGYIFVNWTGNVSAIADIEAAATNITMNGHYAITANFAPRIPENLEIHTWYDLDAVRDNLSGNHTLMNDLDSTTAGYDELASSTANGGKGWEPIGTRSAPFTGRFNGQGHEICDLFIDLPEEPPVPLSSNECVGLFGVIDDGGRIEDVGVVNADVTGFVSVGGLVGEIEHGTVSNSYFTGSVGGHSDVGGLVGWSYEGTVSNSYSIGSVAGDEDIGGLVGRNWGTVSNSHYNYDEVLINGEKVITIGALFGEDFDQWLANDKFLDVNERLSQENGYYVVNNVNDFKQLLAFGQNATLKFRLTNDLDLAAEPSFYIPYFAGEFDGNGHKISNLSFNSDFVYTVGLFGYLAPGGKVTDLGVESVNITGDNLVGGLVGINYEGTVSNSYSTGSVAGYHYCLGGLVGWNGGNVSNSYFTGSVTRAGYVSLYVGGLVGWNEGNVSSSYSTGNVTDGWRIGGLVGENHGTVSNSYSTASVNGRDNVGGLVGWNWGIVSNSYSTGSVSGNWIVGGLVGENIGDVSNSYSKGSVTGDYYVGGLVGENYGDVSNSYSTGSVTGDYYVGGLVGENYGDVSNSYSTGSVTGDYYVGGLVGENQFDGTVSSSFWDTETSGQATSAGGTGKNTTEMQDIATFLGAGWDISTVGGSDERNPAYIWNIPTTPPGYPFLSWQP